MSPNFFSYTQKMVKCIQQYLFLQPGHRLPRYSTINWGICVPASCTAKDVENGLKEVLQPLSSVPEFSLALQVDDEMMYTNEPLNPDLMTWLVM